MRVGFDAGCLLHRQMGVGSYASNLLRALGSLDEDLECVLLANSFRPGASMRALSSLGGRFAFRNPRLPNVVWSRLKDRWGLPVELFCGPVDVFHSLDPVAPRTLRAGCVATVHDLIDFALPDLFPEHYLATPQLRRFYGARQDILRAAVSRCHRLIAVSQNTRRDLVRYLGIPEDRIVVIPYGIEPEFRPMDAESRRRVLARYRVPEEGFLLYVGRIEHRKNLQAILEAMVLLRRSPEKPSRLVICGWQGFTRETEQGLESIRRMGLEGNVVLVDYVAHQDLAAFYSAAGVVVYPSFYEGFGLPPLEAMACGAPVVASNTSSLPEVVGAAALSIDPRNYRGLADAISAATTDPALRRMLRERGLERASLFSWRRVAEETLKVYRLVKRKRWSPR